MNLSISSIKTKPAISYDRYSVPSRQRFKTESWW